MQNYQKWNKEIGSDGNAEMIIIKSEQKCFDYKSLKQRLHKTGRVKDASTNPFTISNGLVEDGHNRLVFTYVMFTGIVLIHS